MLTVPEILKELEPCTGRFPLEAMRAALLQREAIKPELLRVIDALAEDPVGFAGRKDYMLHIFAVYLLAQFREKQAYPLLAKIVNAPGELPFDLFGDMVTEGLGRILASLYDGDPAPLERLVETETVNGYVRIAAIDAFLVLEHSGQISREKVIHYFQQLFDGKLQRNYSLAWDGLVSAVADMPAPELRAEVRLAYKDGLVNSGFCSLDGLESDLQTRPQGRRERHLLITDVIEEMEWWASFHEEDLPPQRLSPPEAPPEQATVASYIAPQPIVREPKIGRNAPCPCGSGAKYKKCCHNK